MRVDHRSLGWEEMRGRDTLREYYRSLLEMSPDLSVEPGEVLACDDRVMAVRTTFHGLGAVGGGELEIPLGYVFVVRDGRIELLENYDPDDTAAMLARYAELGGIRDVLGDRPPERIVAEWIRRFNAHDVDGLMDLVADDHVRVDHRSLGWEEIGNEGTRSQLLSLFAAAPDMRVDVDEVLASDNSVIAYSFTFHGTNADGGGPFEIPVGVVSLFENGMMTRADLYEHDDRQAMIARYAELGGGQGPLGDRPPERTWREMLQRFARHSDAILDLWADDFIGVDHRSLGWSETDKAGMRDVVESMLSASLDVRAEVDEVLACDDRVLALLGAFRGHSADGGGAFEIAMGYVVQVELGGRPEILGDRPPERVVARLCRRWTDQNLDDLVDLFTDDVVRVDHRTLGYDEVHGRAGIRETYASMFGVSAEVRVEPEEVIARDDRILALRATLRGTAAAGGGEFATPCGYVFAVADGRIQRLEQFEPDDRQQMIARYVELGGGLGPLGDRPPERVHAEMLRRFARHDVDGFVDLFADDFVVVDHRTLGWPESDKKETRRLVESMLATPLDVRVEVDEVLACDDRVMAVRHAFRGHSAEGGGPFEIANGFVGVYEDGRMCRMDRYESGDREAMLDRYAELGGRLEIPRKRESERVFSELVRAATARDVEGYLRLLAADQVSIDHRGLSWETETTNSEAAARLEAVLAASADARFEVDELLACDDRVLAALVGIRGTSNDGGGAFEIAYGAVGVVEDGVVTRIERYEPGDRQAMVARYTELGGGLGPLGDRPPERIVGEVVRRFAQGANFDEFCTVDYAMVDHRTLGWAETDRQGHRSIVDSMLAASLDVRVEVDEVLACNDHVIALVMAFHGHTSDGGGALEIPYGLVVRIASGLISGFDRYEPEDREAMLGRYAELTAGTHGALGDRPPERFMADFICRWAERDVDRLLELYAPDYITVDHRTLAWEEMGKDDVRPMLESMLGAQSDGSFEIDEVLACDDRVIALSITMHGTNNDGGGAFEIPFGGVAVIESGLMRRLDRYEPTDRQAMLARYAELSG